MSEWSEKRFSSITGGENYARTLAKVLPNETFRSCLDVGCGTGELQACLTDSFRLERGVGIDISEPSIRAAKERFRNLDLRREDVVGSSERLGTFDLVVSESVFQMIPVPGPRLAKSLADLCRPDGYLSIVMPSVSLKNRFLVGFRRLLRFFESPFLHGAILRLAKLAYPKLPEAQLRERIPYMFLVPYRFFEGSFQKELEKEGFEMVTTSRWPGISAFKLDHRFYLLRKTRAI